MEYRLLIDFEVITFLDAMPKSVRSRLLGHLVRLRSTPDQCSDCYEHDRIGRRVEISIFAGHSIHYWIDVSDRHVKVLAVKLADR